MQTQRNLAGELALHQHDDEHAGCDGCADQQQPGEPRQRCRHRNLLSKNLLRHLFSKEDNEDIFYQENLDLRTESHK